MPFPPILFVNTSPIPCANPELTHIKAAVAGDLVHTYEMLPRASSFKQTTIMTLPDSIPPPSPPPFQPSLNLLVSPMAKESVVDTTPLATLRYKEKIRGTKRAVGGDSITVPSSFSSNPDGRQLAPLKTTSRRTKSSSVPSPSNHTTPGGSRESSPVAETASSPIKRARTSSLSGEIRNFHLLSSDDESDTEGGGSPTIRSRSRFNQFLGPSPLQKSFSSNAVPQVSRRRIMLERAVTTPPTTTEGTIRTRAKVLLGKEEVENLGTELNKVFALVHGRGLGMGSTGGGRHRRGSALRPKGSEGDGQEKDDGLGGMDVDD